MERADLLIQSVPRPRFKDAGRQWVSLRVDRLGLDIAERRLAVITLEEDLPHFGHLVVERLALANTRGSKPLRHKGRQTYPGGRRGKLEVRDHPRDDLVPTRPVTSKATKERTSRTFRIG